jgi:hypothetical protein
MSADGGTWGRCDASLLRLKGLAQNGVRDAALYV